MPDILVVRGSGLSQGEDIIAPLLSTDTSCLARGRVALDDSSGIHPVTIECIYRSGLLLGDLVELVDPVDDAQVYGKITSIEHSVSQTEVVTTIVVSVKTEFLI